MFPENPTGISSLHKTLSCGRFHLVGETVDKNPPEQQAMRNDRNNVGGLLWVDSVSSSPPVELPGPLWEVIDQDCCRLLFLNQRFHH